MLKGIRVVSVAKGFDPREFCVVAFGGAGPVHASELARELDIPRVLVPIAPGVTSALGLMMADMRHDYVRTVLKLAEESTPADIGERYAEMETEALAQMDREGIPGDTVSLLRLADARYLGQGFELEIQVDGGRMGPAQAGLTERFHDAHKRRYGYESHDNPVEIVNLRVVALANLPRPQLAPAQLEGGSNPSAKGSREIYFDGKLVSAAVYDRNVLSPGNVVSGPAVIEQLDSTTVVWPKQQARVDARRNLMLNWM